MTDVTVHSTVSHAGGILVAADSDPFGVWVTRVIKSFPTFEREHSADVPVTAPLYLSRRGGMLFGGSWAEVAARVESGASTSSQGSLTRGLDGAPHPKPVAAFRVRQLKDDSGLTWDQLRRLFGVSRRALHSWAGGARMNSRNEERLVCLESVIAALEGGATERRDALLGSSPDGGRSIFQQLALAPGVPRLTDIEALTESTSAGHTVHGDFLFAEAIDDGDEDR